MRRSICFFGVCLVLLASVSVVRGQNVPKPLNSSFLITEGVKVHDKELYDSARTYFQQVTRNDSLYGTACYEIALGYYAEKAYDSALVYIKKAVNSGQMTVTEQARVLMGSIFGDAGASDSALVCYYEALKRMPYSSKLLYDIGATYYRLDSLDLAERYFIQAITVNPTYYRATFMLGRLNEKMNRRIEAMLCYYMASLINPSVDLTRLVELYLGGESDLVPLLKEYVPTSPSFEKVEDYINSKIAMSDKYKPVFKSPTAFVRQGDILFKYLEYDPKVDNFYMNYFVQLFTYLRDKKQVETAMYIYFSDFNIDKVQKWIKSNSSKIQKFYGGLKSEIWRLAGRGFVNDANYEGMNYVFSNGNLLEFGKYSNEKNKVKEELWQFVEKDGSVSTTMNYKNGKPEGEMKDFNSSGQLTSNIPFVNGVKSGAGRLYHDNGLLKAEGIFENDKLNGKLTHYFYTGQKQAEQIYKNDAENGLTVNYYKNGAVVDSVSWSNGKQNGEYRSFYANNQLSATGRLVNDLIDGELIYYYPDGKISNHGNMVKDNKVGKWVIYYPNGVVKDIAFYNDKGNLADTGKSFDANGILTNLYIYSNNGKNVQRFYYRPDGSVFEKEEVKNDNLVKMESFDINGKSFGEINISNSGTYVKDYNRYGTISAEGMVKNGKTEGRWIFYGFWGNIRQISYYKKGEQNGADTLFFPNGKIKSVGNYKDGKADGYGTLYNQAGKITAEGYCVNDVKEGYWLAYDNSGKMTRRVYFSENEPDQWQQF
jgi:antitoxin component YwqK of YwqJK toxin-antitoxin module